MVLAEMAQDNAVAEVTAEESVAAEQLDLAALPDFEDLLAERDGRIAELEQAVIELSYRIKDLIETNEAAAAAPAPDNSAELRAEMAELARRIEGMTEVRADPRLELETLGKRVDAVVEKIDEQERTLRHTITMLIEWVEGEIDHPQAA
jgi:chromosome segregation ATPase